MLNSSGFRAYLLLQRQRYDLAEVEARRVLAESPQDVMALAVLANCHAKLGRHREALHAAREALRIGPEESMALDTMSFVLMTCINVKMAERAARETLRLYPHEANYHFRLADVLAGQGKWHAALAAADEGLRVDPEHLGCIHVKARAEAVVAGPDAACATTTYALAVDPENAETHAIHGQQLLEADDYQNARRHFEQALRLDPALDSARLGMVQVLHLRHWPYRVLYRLEKVCWGGTQQSLKHIWPPAIIGLAAFFLRQAMKFLLDQALLAN